MDNSYKYRFKSFLKRRQTTHCMIGIVACIFSLYINLVISNLVVLIINRTVDMQEPLDDLLFSVLPHLKGYNLIAVKIPYFLYLLFLLIWFLLESERIKILTALTFTTAIVYFIRSLCIIVTIMPPTQPIDRIDVKINSIWLINSGVSDIYGDCIFSSHVASVTIFFLTFLTYINGKKRLIASIPLGLMWFYICFMVIVTRLDYTSDVLVALFITTPIFLCVRLWIKKYHTSKHKKHNDTFEYIKI